MSSTMPLAGGKNTLLVYMGVSTAGAIARKLLDAGFAPTLPVLAVENASRDDERRVLATVADVAAHSERLRLKSPAVLIFGEVAGLPTCGIVEDILALEEVKRRA
jgi:siroheme synthase